MTALSRLSRAVVRRILRLVFRTVLFALIFVCLWVLSYRVINPPITVLMVSEWIRLGDMQRDWRDLDEISVHLPHAVMGGEDARFCSHYGFDFIEIRKALAEEDRRRGASTISQQVAKNAFLWPDASWLRKGLEAGFTILIELTWGKERIMEVYLNIAEFDEGVFGAEAAAQTYFGKSSADLSLREAARLAAILPNPRGRSASRPSAATARRANAIADGAATLAQSGGAACVAGS
ncbi:MAG: monofunctional biosynthetic peptidoglycan transglycosylase [Pseudomonadota bacterium]